MTNETEYGIILINAEDEVIEVPSMRHWVCPICDERFDDADDASIHWNNAHHDEIEEAWKAHEQQNDLGDK